MSGSSTIYKQVAIFIGYFFMGKILELPMLGKTLT